MRASLIINPAAGRGAGQKLGPHITQHLQTLGIITRPYYSVAATDVMMQVKQALATSPEVIIVTGGDGTVHAAVNGWMQAGGGTPLAMVPIGTGNDFMKMFNSGENWRSACANIARGKTRRVDVGRCNDFYFANSLGVGFDAQVAMAANRMQWLHGNLVYGLALAKVLFFQYRLPIVDIMHDGDSLRTSITLISVCNGSSEGGSFLLAPGAHIDDGIFDVVIARGLSRAGILKLVPRVMRGTHVAHPAVSILRAGKLSITSDTGLPVHADGEIHYTHAHSLDIEILPLALTVIA
jgi:diacylglycerol kinase (ATP)